MITDMDAIPLMCGIVYVDLPALIEVGITASYLDDDADALRGGPQRHGRWYARDLLRRE